MQVTKFCFDLVSKTDQVHRQNVEKVDTFLARPVKLKTTYSEAYNENPEMGQIRETVSYRLRPKLG